MLPFPRLLAALLALLCLAVAPAVAGAAAPAAHAPSAQVASDDGEGGEDPGDEWDEQDPGDPGDEWDDEDWGDDACLASDDACDEEAWCEVDDGSWDEWDDADAATIASDDDDGEGDDDSLGDACDEEPAPLTLSALRATPARHGALKVRFRLDGDGVVTLSLERVGAGASARCGKPAKAAKRRGGDHARRGGKAGGRSCQRASGPVRGVVSLDASAGVNETTLRRWKGQALAPGSYRLTATPETDGSEAGTATFTLRAPGRGR